LVFGHDYVSFAELSKRSPEAAEHGNADFYIAQSNAIGRYAVSDNTEVAIDVSVKALTLRVDENDEHHRDETVTGIGDIRLTMKSFVVFNHTLQLAGIIGVSLPTGKLNSVTAASYLGHEEAAAIGATVPKHSHIQLGSGTLDPIIGAEALVRLNSRWMLFGNGTVTAPFYANKYDYRTSAIGSLTMGAARRQFNGALIPSFSVELFYSSRDKFDGPDIVGDSGVFDGNFWVPNTGRFETSVKPGVVIRLKQRLTLTMQMRVPVYTRIREDAENGDIQLTEPVSVFSALSLGL